MLAGYDAQANAASSPNVTTPHGGRIILASGSYVKLDLTGEPSLLFY